MMAMVASQGVFASADATVATFIPIDVVGCELVSLFAVCPLSVKRPDDIGANAALQVFPSSDRFEVVGPDAGAVAAEVIQVQAFRNLTSAQFVGDAVGKGFAPSAIGHASDSEDSVAITVPLGLPFPAVRAFSHLLPESLSYRPRRLSMHTNIVHHIALYEEVHP